MFNSGQYFNVCFLCPYSCLLIIIYCGCLNVWKSRIWVYFASFWMSFLLLHVRAVDCVFSEWSVWTDCSVTCANGTRSRSRERYGPYHNGKECDGPLADEEVCVSASCPGKSGFFFAPFRYFWRVLFIYLVTIFVMRTNLCYFFYLL